MPRCGRLETVSTLQLPYAACKVCSSVADSSTGVQGDPPADVAQPPCPLIRALGISFDFPLCRHSLMYNAAAAAGQHGSTRAYVYQSTRRASVPLSRRITPLGLHRLNVAQENSKAQNRCRGKGHPSCTVQLGYGGTGLVEFTKRHPGSPLSRRIVAAVPWWIGAPPQRGGNRSRAGTTECRRCHSPPLCPCSWFSRMLRT
jgi:hypothetical protein